MKVFSKSEDISDACMSSVTVETTGFQGGDGGHGGYASLTLKNEGGTCMEAVVDGHAFDVTSAITIKLLGDAEIRTLQTALLFAASALDDLLEEAKTSE